MIRLPTGSIVNISSFSDDCHEEVSLDEEARGYTLACRVAPTEAVRLEVAGRLNKPFSVARATVAPAHPPTTQTKET